MNKVSLKKIRHLLLGGNIWLTLGNLQLQGATGGFGLYLYNLVINPTTLPYNSVLYPNPIASQGSLNSTPLNTNFSPLVLLQFLKLQESLTLANIDLYRLKQWLNTTNIVQGINKAGSILSASGDPTLMKIGALANPTASLYETVKNWNTLNNGLRVGSLAGISNQVFGIANLLLPKTEGNPFNSKAVLGLALTVAAINPVAGGIALAGLFAVNLLDKAFGKRAHSFTINLDTLNLVGSDYSDTTEDIYKAKAKSGKKYSIFNSGGRRRANRFIDATNVKLNIMTDISDNARRILAQSSDANALRFNMAQNGGINLQYLRVAKLGTKLPKIKEKIEWQPVITIDDPIKLEKGGNVTILVTVIKEPKEEPKEEAKNVIPAGALHANKHHMDNADSLTQKGIPVVDDKGEQQAEIEKDEIILHLKLTNKLEELQEKYEKASKTEQDKLAIEAGKLLVEEILHNTIDNTNLIDKCEKGGKINGSI